MYSWIWEVLVPATSRILAVHGYACKKENGEALPGTLAESVCQKVSAIQHNYTQIFLLGGWHTADLGPNLTIGDVMKKRLLALGIPADKLVVCSRFYYMSKFLPPRDTCEEEMLLIQVLNLVGNFTLDIVAIEQWLPRIKLITKHIGTPVSNFLGVKAALPFSARVQEMVLYLLSLRDPLGEYDGPAGTIFRFNRGRRTLASTGRGHLMPL